MTDLIGWPYAVVFRVDENDTYGVFLKYFVRRYSDEGNLLRSEMEWSRTGAKSAPLRSGASSSPGAEQSVLRSLHGVERASSRGTKTAAPHAKTGAGESQKVKLENELSDLRLEITELAKEIASIDGVLAPVWAAEREAREVVLRTHGRDPAHRIVFLQAGAPRRVAPYRELLELAEQWGPFKSERRELVNRMRAYERLAERLAKMLKGKPRKGARA